MTSRILLSVLQLALVPILSPLFVGIIRKIKAKLQNRVGAGIFQPYRDLRKLFRKDEVISEDASWIFRFAPYIVFTVTVLIGASIPIFVSAYSGGLLGDLLVFVYMLAISTFFLALAGMDTGSAFGGFGSSREMTLAALTEGGLIFSVLALAIAMHSSNLFDIARAIPSLPMTSLIPVVLAFFAFMVALLAETARFPFDNPATHLELTMVHEAMILEYSGRRLALMEWSAANKLLIFLTLGANLFLPGSVVSMGGPGGLALAFALYLVKVILLCAFIAVLESVIAKYRFFRLPDLLLTSFVLSVIAIILII